MQGILQEAKNSLMDAISVKGLNNETKNSTFTGSHESDLKIRLQNVANKAKPKGQRKPIGSTDSFAMIRKKDNNNLKRQFRGTVNKNGIHSLFLKDGQLQERIVND